MTPTQLAEVHQHDKTGSLPIVSRALLECEARAKRLEEALRDLEELFAREGEGYNCSFERVGEAFHRETGYLRPGKDCCIHDPGVRREAWDAWLAKRLDAARAALREGGSE